MNNQMTIHFGVLTAVSAASKSFAPVYPALLDYPNIFTVIIKKLLARSAGLQPQHGLGQYRPHDAMQTWVSYCQCAK